MKPKILVIPSWYPTIDSPTIGSFCKEQTELAANEFDIKVIYPKLRLVSKKDTLKKLFRANTISVKKHLLGAIDGVELEARVSTFLSYKDQMAFLAKGSAEYLRCLIATGWTPEIIHAHGTMPAGLIAASLAALGDNIPYLITEHHSLLVSDFDAERWTLYKQAQEGAKLVMVVSNELKKMILMNGVDCKTESVGNLLDEEFFQPVMDAPQRKTFKILFIAVPAKTKDIPTFIRALEQVKSSGAGDFRATLIIPDVQADLNKDDIRQMSADAGVLENCLISGGVAHDSIPSLLNDADVLVSTSITETFGLSVAEAIMCGKPVIATRSGGVEDFVTPHNGILVNIGDYNAISRAIIQLMKGEIGFNAAVARAEMVARFGKNAFSKHIFEIYNRCIND